MYILNVKGESVLKSQIKTENQLKFWNIKFQITLYQADINLPIAS